MALRLDPLFRLFKKSSLPVNDDEIVSPTIYTQPEVQLEKQLEVLSPREPLTPLPVELWQEIASIVENEGDLSRLCRSCRALHLICEPYLYHSLRIEANIYKMRRIEALIRTIQTRYFENLVKYLHVNCSTPDPTLPGCPRVDELVGKMIVPLCNLQKLTFQCSMYTWSGGVHHLYLTRLETRKLEILILDCKSLNQRGLVLFQTLNAPCMHGIVSISLGEWLCRPLNFVEQSVVEGDSFLPCLKEITSYNFIPFGAHLRRGSITSIRNDESRSDLATVLSNCPPGLVYLHHDLLQNFIPRIIRDPSPYLKLRSMTGFVFDNFSDPGKIRALLKDLSGLPNLSCIEVSVLYRRPWSFDTSHSYSKRNNPALVQDLRQELRKLSKVYILRSWEDWHNKQHNFKIWELMSDKWQSKDIDEDNYRAAVRKEGHMMHD